MVYEDSPEEVALIENIEFSGVQITLHITPGIFYTGIDLMSLRQIVTVSGHLHYPYSHLDSVEAEPFRTAVLIILNCQDEIDVFLN